MKKKLPFFLALIISVPIITLIVFLLAGVKADNANVADGESYMAALKDADINKIEHKINENRQTGSSTEPVTPAPTEQIQQQQLQRIHRRQSRQVPVISVTVI